MLEDLRKEADESSHYEELGSEDETEAIGMPSQPVDRLFGMTAFQRLIVAILLLIVTCLLSTICLMATQKVVPPFLF